MAMVSLWGNMCTMSALRVSRLVSSWVRCTRRISSPSCRNKMPADMDGEEVMEESEKLILPENTRVLCMKIKYIVFYLMLLNNLTSEQKGKQTEEAL